MSTTIADGGKNNQRVGNVGLYYVCYRLSQDGWNVMPTARNARGVDILAYDQKGERKLTVQVKALSNHPGVPLGESLDSLIADFVVICFEAGSANPRCSIMKPTEIRRQVIRRDKDGKLSHWLSSSVYLKVRYMEKWKRIGLG